VYVLVGWRFMVYMAVNYLFLKGMSYGSGFGILEKGIIPYYNDVLHASGAQLNLAAGTISPLAYSLKPLMALGIDTFPIWGYHKRYYVVITAVLAVICNLLLALLPADASWGDAAMALAFLFAVPVFECALTDLICEGVYAAVMRDNPESSADLPTFANTIINIGALIAPQLVGHLADTKGPKYVFFIGAALGAPIIIPALLGWQPEEKVDQKGSLVDEAKLRFDFSHGKQVEDEELRKIEQIVNEEIEKKHAVCYKEVPLASQRRTMPSCDAVTTFVESGEKARAQTASSCFSNVCNKSPSFALHNLAKPSSEPVITVEPSGEAVAHRKKLP